MYSRIKIYAIMLLSVSCAHNERPAEILNKVSCPRPVILTKTEAWSAEDESMIARFKTGCIKHFTKNHCPIRVLKTKRLSYQVTCKKVK